MAIMLREVLVDLVGLLTMARRFKVLQSGFDDRAARFFLLGSAATGASQAQGADQRRQGESLKHKRYEDHAEREEDDHVPLSEGLSVVEHLGQCYCGGE